MAVESLKLNLKEMGLPYLLANAAIEIGNYAKGRIKDLRSVFMTGELLHELSNDEEALSSIDYVFREPLEKCYGKRWGKDIQTFQDLEESLEEVSRDYMNIREISDEKRRKLGRFSLSLYGRMLYYQKLYGSDFLDVK